MIRKIEFYIFRRDFFIKADGTTKGFYLVSNIRQAQEKNYNLAKDIAADLTGLLKEYDTIVLYESLDTKVEGKPRLTLTKDSVIVESLSSPTILREVQKGLVEMLGQK